ncbi:MAG: sensor histidine kinase, partial [Lachnospiraceae bacterium]|nr:sensor histidine kinase [Lachnospiraceae bacterium]
MEFLYEKRVRNFFLCFVALCVFQVCFMGLSGLFQAQVLRRALMERELGAASYLLDRGVPSTVLASAWNHREGTEAGRALLEKIGHTEQNRNYIMLLAEETSVPVLRLMAAEGILFSAILLLCLGIFLRGQERMYEKAEKIIAEYAEGRFDTHLWKGGAGAFCRLSGQCRHQVN